MPKWQLFAILGLFLLIPSAMYLAYDPVRPADLRVAFERLATVPIGQVEGNPGVDVTATIPNSAAWTRIIRHWGTPGFIVAAVSPGPKRFMYCLKDFGVHVEVRVNGQPVKLGTAEYPPYGYSSDCRPVGLWFRAPQGAVVAIRLHAEGKPLRAIDLIVEPYWSAGIKDDLVGIAIDQDLHFRAFTVILCAAGLAALLFAAFLFWRDSRRPVG